MKWKAATVALFMGAVLMGARPAQATAIDFAFTTNFGSTPTTGTLLGRLSDSPGGGDLLLTLIAAFPADGASLDAVYFNLNPAINPLGVTFTLVNDTTGGAFESVDRGTDAYRADGDGYFDFRLNFSEGANPPQFGPVDTVSFLISGPGSLTLQDFVELSAPGPGESPGPFFGAAHVQNIGPTGNSTWLGVGVRPTPFEEPPGDDEPPTPVPEPASLVMLGSGLLAVARSRKLIR
jgi:hypothetical protein